MDLHFVFNSGIALSYILIPVGLCSLVVKAWRQLTPFFRGTVLKFCAFILACAIGHALEAFGFDHHITTPWHGVTFLISALTAYQMHDIANQVVDFIRNSNQQAQALQASKAQFEGFLEDCPHLVSWIRDENRRYVWASRTMIKLFGEHSDEWLPAKAVTVTLEKDLRVLETGEPYEFVESVAGVDGELRVWLSYKFLLPLGELPYIGGIAIEITEREQLREEVERINAELEQFAYAASHDLRTPIRGISGLLSILERKMQDRLDAQEQKIFGQIIKDCAYATELVNGILAYSRIGRLQGELQSVDVNEVLSQVSDRFQEQEASITWEAMPTIRADAIQLTQVFENLIGNALKYRGNEPPQIKVIARSTRKEWVFAVQDNGIGIDPEYQDQLFAMFKRLHGREIEGTGIGLATVLKIAQRHGGNAWVKSQGAGYGSTFYFSVGRHL